MRQCPVPPAPGCLDCHALPSSSVPLSSCHTGLQIRDEEVLRLFYEEAKGNVLTARYPCDLEDCEVLGALICRVQLGPYQPGQAAACTLR